MTYIHPSRIKTFILQEKLDTKFSDHDFNIIATFLKKNYNEGRERGKKEGLAIENMRNDIMHSPECSPEGSPRRSIIYEINMSTISHTGGEGASEFPAELQNILGQFSTPRGDIRETPDTNAPPDAIGSSAAIMEEARTAPFSGLPHSLGD